MFLTDLESGKFKMKTLTGLVSGQGYCLRKYLLLSGRKAEPNTVLTAWEMLKGRGHHSSSPPFSPYTDANTRLNPADCMLPWRSSQHHNLGSQVPACVDGLERHMSVMEEILQYPYNLNILKNWSSSNSKTSPFKVRLSHTEGSEWMKFLNHQYSLKGHLQHCNATYCVRYSQTHACSP